jgi:hypothetical protein
MVNLIAVLHAPHGGPMDGGRVAIGVIANLIITVVDNGSPVIGSDITPTESHEVALTLARRVAYDLVNRESFTLVPV